MDSWTCPVCNQTATLSYSRTSESRHRFDTDIKHGTQVVRTKVITCPNPNCLEFTLTATLHRESDVEPAYRTWQLVPASESKTFPDYVPQAIRADYDEACLIRDLSPKASATLSRRCLQGIIRDFWNISKPRLIDEIHAIKDQVDPLTWAAIDAVRKIGNIGAHMEKDFNLIIEVDPQEARLLIGLIETLITDWYVLRHHREEQLRTIVELSNKKKKLKTEAVDIDYK
jgi:Domain of unknown function (DUF4145)